jgi:hypothetical protein
LLCQANDMFNFSAGRLYFVVLAQCYTWGGGHKRP